MVSIKNILKTRKKHQKWEKKANFGPLILSLNF